MKDNNEDSNQDDDLAKIMKELEDDDNNKAQGYNRSNFIFEADFFSEDKTPSNTPSNKANKEVNLKQIDFDSYLNVFEFNNSQRKLSNLEDDNKNTYSGFELKKKL